MTERDDQEFPDEVDVDLADEAEIRADEGPETPEDGGEFVGEYESVDAYFAGMLGELVHPDIAWILDYVDFGEVRRRFEADGSQYFCAAGAVYRRG